MPSEILNLAPRANHIQCSDFYERWLDTYKIPSWAADELKDFSVECGVAISEIVERRIWQAGSTLFNMAEATGCKTLGELMAGNIKSALDSIDDIMLRPWLKRLTLWLVVEGKLGIDVAATGLFDNDEQVARITEQTKKYDERTVALDLIDSSIDREYMLKAPAWCSDEYCLFCSGLPKTKYLNGQKRQALLMVRWIDRRHSLTSCGDLKPSMLLNYRAYRGPSDPLDVRRNENFVKFLCDQGILPGFMVKASMGGYDQKWLTAISREVKSDEVGQCSAVELYSLRDDVCSTLRKLGYTNGPITNAKAALTNHSLHLYELGRSFNLDYAMHWCSLLPEEWCRWNYPVALFIASRLLAGQEVTVDMLMDEHYKPRLKKAPPFLQWSEPIITEYLAWEIALGWSENTIGCKRRAIHKFTEYLQTRGCTDFSALKVEHINGFVLWDHHKTLAGKSCYNLKIRGFLGYLADKGVIPYKVALAMPGCCGTSVRPVKILTPEQREEVRRFCSEAVSEKDSRIKLALLLALRMGMRAVDINHLKLCDINLDTNELEFVQQKTKHKLKLPIPDEVLEGLCQYLLRTPRSNIDNERVMLSVKAPHQKLKRIHIQDSFKNLDCGHFSLHDCRRTLASDMLAAGVNMWTIVATLGHVELDNVHLYLTAETDMLRECCLPMDGFALSEEVWS